MWVIALCLIALLVVRISHWIYTWANPKCNGKLPPGSMGLPIIGETLEFFAPHSMYGIPPFLKKRMSRYGSLFRTSLVGQKVVVSTDPEISYSIMNQENKSLLFWCTDSLNEIMGEQHLLSHHGSVHKYLRNLFLRLVGRENLRTKLLHEIDETVRRHLQAWSSLGTVNVHEASSQMTFEYASKKLISYDEKKYSKKLRENYIAFREGIVSFPLYVPGAAFYECLQGRKNVLKVIKDIYKERKEESKTPHHDFLDSLIEEVGKENAVLNDSVAIDLLFLLIFAAFETISESITLITKFINDRPDVLAELTKEHEAILSRREEKDSAITWEEYKSMTFTHMVINETVRLANIAPVTFRKVLKDLEIKGYTIPAGWVIMIATSIVHFDPERFENPYAFNPWRWEGKELHTGTRSFMAFGGGVRLCTGAEYAKVHLALFLHYFITKYRWSVIKGGEVFKRPGLKFPNGLHIEIAEQQK